MTIAAPKYAIVGAQFLAVTLALSGCWTPPVATVRPKGQPRLIEDSIVVESVRNPATVESVDPSARTIVVLTPGERATSTLRVGPRVSNFDRIKSGDEVEATITEQLAVYVSRAGEVPGVSEISHTVAATAKVVSVDSSYRLLTLQHPNGRNETFKLPLDVKLKEMEAGDDVLISPLEAVALCKQKR
jgi:hypothetical protein